MLGITPISKVIIHNIPFLYSQVERDHNPQPSFVWKESIVFKNKPYIHRKVEWFTNFIPYLFIVLSL